MQKHCLNCGADLKEKRGGAKFCSLECKNHYSYQHRSQNLSGVTILPKKEHDKPAFDLPEENQLELSLKGVIEQEKQPEKFGDKRPYKEPSVDMELFNDLLGHSLFSEKLPALRNVIDSSELDGEGEQDTEEETEYETEEEVEEQEPVNIPLPEKYINKTVKAENPLYTHNKESLDYWQERKKTLEQDYHKLEAMLKEQQGRNGNDIVATTGIGGALFGILKDQPAPDLNVGDMTLKDRKGKTLLQSKKGKQWKKPEEENFWSKLGKGLLWGGVGAGLGLIAKGATEDWREKDKKQKIADIKSQMEHNRQEYKKALERVSYGKTLLGTIPEKISKTVPALNPEYSKALNGIENKKGTNNNKTEQQMKNTKQKEKVQFKSNKIRSATDLGDLDHKSLNFQGLWRSFFGLPSINFHILIHGNSGEGKSTFCLWFAKYLAENFGRVLYVSGEEGLNKTFHDKLKYCKAEVDNLHILDVRTGDEVMQEVGTQEFHFIVLDSLHDMEIDAKKLKQIFERYKHSAFICIDQNNKKGELFGANEKKHICDVVVNVKNYAAEITKTRFGTKGIICKTADFANGKGAKVIPINSQKDKGYNLDSDRRGLV